MPRPKKVINNGPVDVPAPPSAQAISEAAMPEVPVNKAYRSTGKATPAVPDKPFGAGADYPKNTYHTRLYDPANGAVYQFTMADTELAIWQGTIDRFIETGLQPCNAPDAPKAPSAPRSATKPADADDDEDMEQDDLFSDDKRIGRNARTQRNTSPGNTILTFGQHEGKTIRQVYNSGKRGESYVAWLAENARDRDVRNAARDVLE